MFVDCVEKCGFTLDEKVKAIEKEAMIGVYTAEAIGTDVKIVCSIKKGIEQAKLYSIDYISFFYDNVYSNKSVLWVHDLEK